MAVSVKGGIADFSGHVKPKAERNRVVPRAWMITVNTNQRVLPRSDAAVRLSRELDEKIARVLARPDIYLVPGKSGVPSYSVATVPKVKVEYVVEWSTRNHTVHAHCLVVAATRRDVFYKIEPAVFRKLVTSITGKAGHVHVDFLRGNVAGLFHVRQYLAKQRGDYGDDLVEMTLDAAEQR